MLFILLIILFLLLCFVLFGNVYICLRINTDKGIFDLFCRILGIKINLPTDNKRKKQSGKQSNIFSYIKYINIKKLYADITIGTGNAAADALAVGGLRALFGMLYSVIRKNAECNAVNVKIMPDFENTVLKAETESIISIKIRNIILQAIKNMRRN